MTAEIFSKRYFQLPRAEIGHLRFILESYDGLAFARTLDSRAGLVEIACSASRTEDVDALLIALGEEAGLREVPMPDNIPQL